MLLQYQVRKKELWVLQTELSNSLGGLEDTTPEKL